jgi:hypothetical protein
MSKESCICQSIDQYQRIQNLNGAVSDAMLPDEL